MNNLKTNFKTIWFLIRTIQIGLTNLLIYKFRGGQREEIIENLCKDLSNQNIFYTKLFQFIVTNHFSLTTSEKNIVRRYINKVPYEYKEINLDFIKKLNETAKYHNHNFNIAVDDDSYDSPNIKPIYSGTIAFIYEGQLNGKEIVIKVKKNNIEENITECFNIFKKALEWLSVLPIFFNLNLVEMIEYNKESFLNQVNFQKELENMVLFKNKMSNIDYIYIPEVYEMYTRENNDIIVMEKIPIIDINIMENNEKIKLAEHLYKCMHKFYFDCLIHNDLHLGNMSFLNNKLVLLDFGNCKTLNSNNNCLMLGLGTAISNNNRELVKELIYSGVIEKKPKNLGGHPPTTDTSSLRSKFETQPNSSETLKEEEFENEVTNLVNLFFETFNSNNSKGALSFSDIIKYNQSLNKYGFKLSNNFIDLQLATLIINSSICEIINDTDITLKQVIENAHNDLLDFSLFSLQ